LLKWCREFAGQECYDLRDVPLPVLRRWAGICEAGQLIDRLSDTILSGNVTGASLKMLEKQKQEIMRSAGFHTPADPDFARWYRKFKNAKVDDLMLPITMPNGVVKTIHQSRRDSLRWHVKLACAKVYGRGVAHGRT
jgi:hypothetical protein